MHDRTAQSFDKGSCDNYSSHKRSCEKEELVHQHPALTEALVRDHVTALRQSARTTADIRPQRQRLNGIGAARLGAGWLLIEMGLRLAIPRSDRSRPVARWPR